MAGPAAWDGVARSPDGTLLADSEAWGGDGSLPGNAALPELEACGRAAGFPGSDLLPGPVDEDEVAGSAEVALVSGFESGPGIALLG